MSPQERDNNDRDHFHEPLLSMELQDAAAQLYPYLTKSKADCDDMKRHLIEDQIAWHEREIERLKATITDDTPINAPF